MGAHAGRDFYAMVDGRLSELQRDMLLLSQQPGSESRPHVVQRILVRMWDDILKKLVAFHVSLSNMVVRKSVNINFNLSRRFHGLS